MRLIFIQVVWFRRVYDYVHRCIFIGIGIIRWGPNTLHQTINIIRPELFRTLAAITSHTRVLSFRFWPYSGATRRKLVILEAVRYFQLADTTWQSTVTTWWWPSIIQFTRKRFPYSDRCTTIWWITSGRTKNDVPWIAAAIIVGLILILDGYYTMWIRFI